MYYTIRVKGHLGDGWSAWFEPLIITNAENGEAVLGGDLIDQAALHGMLIKVRDLGLPLISVDSGAGDRRPRIEEDPDA
ncbi:MAG: hypothetical protein ACJ78Q_06425 [Chloroflexia bacterium]